MSLHCVEEPSLCYAVNRFGMQPVTDTIRQHLDNRDMRFIFPSEVAAAFWRREALSLTLRRAVRADRFLSWDRFKEEIFARKQDAVPANSFVRICFAADLLSRNAEGKGLFRSLVLPQYRDSWRPFVRSVARMLPTLDELLQDGQVIPFVDPGLREEFTVIARLYREFLESHGFYEPLHEPKGVVSSPEGIVFFSDVVLDFAEYEPFLDRMKVELFNDRGSLAATVVSYSNARVEVKQTCLVFRALLDAGIAPSAIAVTLTDPNGYVEELSDIAALYDIPITCRAGKPLADYTEVALYRKLSDCVASGFALSSLKALFINAAYPWRNPEHGRELLRFGIDNYGIQNLSGSAGQSDEWRRRLKPAGKPKLLEFYGRFKRAAESITGAASFSSLRAAVMSFNNSFLDTGGFSESQSLPFSAALDLLAGIEETSAHLQDLKMDSPFSLWMAYLAERRYVHPGRGNGIRVYEYRVAAGIYPEYHFILGVCQEASAVRKPQYPFVPLNMGGEGLQSKGDFTEAFMRLYQCSGRNVVFSGCKESFDGPVTPVRYFTSADPLPAQKDLYASEIRFWAGDGLEPRRVYRQQRSGLEYMGSTGLCGKGLDITEQPVTRPALARRITERLTDADGVLPISPSNLDEWYGCKFSYLLHRALGVERIDFDTVYTDPREAGILFHAVLAAALREAAGTPVVEGVDPARTVALVDGVFASWLGTKFLPPVWKDLRLRALECLFAFLKTDSIRFADTRLFTLEDSLKIDAGIPGVVLHGRIDRISERQGSFIVIDYKTNVRKKAAGMVAPDGVLFSFQVPIYLLLVEGTYGSVSEALYYDINKADYANVFGGAKPWFDGE